MIKKLQSKRNSLLIAASQFIFIFIFLCNMSMAQVKNNFKCTVWQNGEAVRVENNICTLQKMPFILKFDLTDTMGVMVQASFSNNVFKSLVNNEDVNNILAYGSGRGMAEYEFNKDKEIIVNDSAYSYWYVDSLPDNRFDIVQPVNKGFHAERTIQQVFVVDEENDKRFTIALADIMQPLYVCIISTNTNAETEKLSLINKMLLQINWVDKKN